MTHSPLKPDSGSLIQGKAYRLGDDISADDILAPEYLSFDLDDPDERKWLGAYALSTMRDRFGTFVETGQFQSLYSIVSAGERFGHGSARSHSAIALAEAGVRCVVADSFAAEFLRAAVNGGHLQCVTFAAVESRHGIETGSDVTVDLGRSLLLSGDRVIGLASMGVTREIVEAGGLSAYLNTHRASLE